MGFTSPLAFLFILLHGPRLEKNCGIRWIDLDFDDNDCNVQNAHKNIPIYDEALSFKGFYVKSK